MAAAGQTAFAAYPVGSYNFGTKPPKLEKDATVAERMARMQAKYRVEGLRRTVEGILLVHAHNHLHVLLLQVNSSFFKLPGGRLRPGEDEAEGLRRKLGNKLEPDNSSLRVDWRVGECAGVWWRPNFENALYPYLPPHITRPKEVRRLYVVPLPERCYFAVPKNMRLLAVPLFELHDNVARYGPVAASIPALLSRFRINLAAAGGGMGPSYGLGAPGGAGGGSSGGGMVNGAAAGTAVALYGQQQQHQHGQQQQQYGDDDEFM